MTQFICPNCGSKFFLTSKTGRKFVFQVVHERTVQFIQSVPEDFNYATMDGYNIYCGGCSWQGCLDEVVESTLD